MFEGSLGAVIGARLWSSLHWGCVLLPQPSPPQCSGGMHRAATTLKVWAEVAEEGSNYAFHRSTNADPRGQPQGGTVGSCLAQIWGGSSGRV